jgi:hypothetical protein
MVELRPSSQRVCASGHIRLTETLHSGVGVGLLVGAVVGANVGAEDGANVGALVGLSDHGTQSSTSSSLFSSLVSSTVSLLLVASSFAPLLRRECGHPPTSEASTVSEESAEMPAASRAASTASLNAARREKRKK